MSAVSSVSTSLAAASGTATSVAPATSGFGPESSCAPSRVALIGIIVSHPQSVDQLNALLHQYSQWIIGRMGIPYAKRDVNIISVAVDAPQDIISALSGKLGRLPGVNAKAIYSNVSSDKAAASGSPDAAKRMQP